MLQILCDELDHFFLYKKCVISVMHMMKCWKWF